MTTTTNETRMQAVERTYAEAESIIKGILAKSKAWELEVVSSRYKGFGIRLSLKNCNNRHLDITYTKRTTFQDEGMFTNVATLGEFNMFEANDSLEFYAALGELLANQALLIKLKDGMITCANLFEDLRTKFSSK